MSGEVPTCPWCGAESHTLRVVPLEGEHYVVATPIGTIEWQVYHPSDVGPFIGRQTVPTVEPTTETYILVRLADAAGAPLSCSWVHLEAVLLLERLARRSQNRFGRWIDIRTSDLLAVDKPGIPVRLDEPSSLKFARLLVSRAMAAEVSRRLLLPSGAEISMNPESEASTMKKLYDIEIINACARHASGKPREVVGGRSVPPVVRKGLTSSEVADFLDSLEWALPGGWTSHPDSTVVVRPDGASFDDSPFAKPTEWTWCACTYSIANGGPNYPDPQAMCEKCGVLTPPPFVPKVNR